MNKLSFFPMLTDELVEACGFDCGKYFFSYVDNGHEYGLKQSGKGKIKLSEPTDCWNAEDNGLIFRKTVSIAYPQFLYGKNGLAASDAEIGLCIMWTNRTLTQTGYILPKQDGSAVHGRTVEFYHVFAPGQIKGDLELSLVLYLRKPADNINSDETHLINESGVILGELEKIILDFNSIYMEFPIEECYIKDQPLWWVEFQQWEDPKVDLFSKENICVYLNTANDACPALGEKIKNLEILIDIISTTYFLIFKRLSQDELIATKNDIELYPNSICSIMHQFIIGSDLQWESDEKLLKSIQISIANMLKEGDD